MMKQLKILLFLKCFLLSCSGSIQDRIDANRRLCGPSVHGAAPLYKKNGERYTPAERAQLSLQTLTGQERSEGLTDQSCLDLADGEEFLLVDKKERSFSIVSARLALQRDLRLQSWSPPSFDWDCPAEGKKMRRGRELPMTLVDDFGLKGQSLDLRIQALDREWQRTDAVVEQGPGLKDRLNYVADWDNGSYIVTPLLTNPFGEKENLASGCLISMFTGTPRLDVNLDAKGELFISDGDPLPVTTDAGVDVFYCLADADHDCSKTDDYRSLQAWQFPEKGGHFKLHLRAQDAYGNTGERQPLPLTIDREVPQLQLKWQAPHRNRLGHVERLPFTYYKAKVSLSDDVSSPDELSKHLQCRVRIQIDSVTTVAGSYAMCDAEPCQNQRFEEWTSCSPDIAFRLDESLWKKFPASKEIILEVRTQDERAKPATDSAMLMIDPDLYPQFSADQWQGRILDNIQDMGMISPQNYWLLRASSTDGNAGRHILLGSFGKWTALDLPTGWDPVSLRFSEGRYFALFQSSTQRGVKTLWEWLPGVNHWVQPAGTDGLSMTDAAAIVDRFETGTLWTAGWTAQDAFIQILPGGERRPFACPVWDNPNKRERPRILVQSSKLLTLLSEDRYYTLDPATGRCEITAFPEYQGPTQKLRRRTLFRDQKDRVWTTGKNQIDVLDNGHWRSIDITHQGLHAKAVVTSGAYQFDDGSYVIIRAGDLIFIPDMASLETFAFNKFNTKILNGPVPNSFGESYDGWDPTVFFDEGAALLSVKGGVLTRTQSRPHQFHVPKQWGGGTANFFRLEGGALHLGMVWAGLTSVSEKGFRRYDESNGLPITSVSSALFEAGRLVSLFGVSQWLSSTSVVKVDYEKGAFKKDSLFESLNLRVANSNLRAAERDAQGRLWFSMVDTGDIMKPGGNFFLQGNKLTRVQSCSLKVDADQGMVCAEKFIALPSGEVFWRDNRSVVNENSAVYDLYSWTETVGLVTVTGPGQALFKVHDATEHQGQLWAVGTDANERGILAVYRNQKWETELLPDEGAFHCARLGFNRKGELYCFGLLSDVLVKREHGWSRYPTPRWNAPGIGPAYEPNAFINGHRRYVYFEDGLIWVSRRAGMLELYEIEPAPGSERWWIRLKTCQNSLIYADYCS